MDAVVSMYKIHGSEQKIVIDGQWYDDDDEESLKEVNRYNIYGSTRRPSACSVMCPHQVCRPCINGQVRLVPTLPLCPQLLAGDRVKGEVV